VLGNLRFHPLLQFLRYGPTSFLMEAQPIFRGDSFCSRANASL
jgi:hypothetical protein